MVKFYDNVRSDSIFFLQYELFIAKGIQKIQLLKNDIMWDNEESK